MTNLILISSLLFVSTIQNPRKVFPSLLGPTGVMEIESAIPNENLDFSVQGWGGFFFDDPYISSDKHSRNRMRLTANFNIKHGVEFFTGTSFVFNESSNSTSSNSSTSLFENTDIGVRWGKFVAGNWLAVGLEGYGRFFSGTRVERNKSGFSRDSSGPFASAELSFLTSVDMTEKWVNLPLRSHFNIGYRTPNGDLKPSGTANREDQIEMFNLDSFKYHALTGGFAFEMPFKWVNPFAEYTFEQALFTPGTDSVKFKHNRHKIGVGAKATPHEAVAIMLAAQFGLMGDTAATTVAIPQNNPWEVFFGLAFTANTKDLFKTVGSLRGQVTDAQTGLPLPDVEATLVGEVTLPRVTDLSGHYELKNLDVKEFQIKFVKEGYKAQTQTVKIRGGEITNLDVALAPPGPRIGNIQGTVIDGTTGMPIPKAYARVVGMEQPYAADENGLLNAEGLVVGPKTVRIEAPGYLPQEFPVEIFENETIKQNFSLQKEPSKIGTVAGRVVNAEGTGLTAVVTSTDEKVSPFGTNPVNGNFNQPLPEGEYELKIVAENYLPETVKVSVKPGETANIDVTLKKPEKAMVVDNRIILPDAIFFAFNSDKVVKRSFEVLNQIVTILKENDGNYKILRVEGHTDDVGSNAFNEALSQKRAQSVRKYIINKGIPADKVEAVGYGEVKPIATNLNDDGRSENRRVEFHLVRENEGPGAE